MERKMKTKMTVDLDKAIAYVECLLDGLRNRTLVMEHNEGKMTLRPGALVELEIETEEENGTQELEIELKWRTDAGSSSSASELLMRQFTPFSR